MKIGEIVPDLSYWSGDATGEDGYLLHIILNNIIVVQING